MSENYRSEWELAFRALERFFDEGMTVWSREAFNSLFSSERVAVSEYVIENLEELERQGSIVFAKEEVRYIEVIKI